MVGTNYIEKIQRLAEEIKEKESGNIKKAAEVMASAIAEDNVIHAFGTGHSHMIAIEMFVRAGGLAPINAMIDQTLVTSSGARKGTKMERLPGLAQIIWDEYKIYSNDVMIIISNSGRNVVPVEMAMLAKEKGLYLIAITSKNHTENSESRHPSGKKMYEFADLVIDNHVPKGDCLVDVNGVGTGPASTVSGSIIANAIVAETLSILSKKGGKLPVFTSQNVDAYNNDDLYEKYANRIKHM